MSVYNESYKHCFNLKFLIDNDKLNSPIKTHLLNKYYSAYF